MFYKTVTTIYYFIIIYTTLFLIKSLLSDVKPTSATSLSQNRFALLCTLPIPKYKKYFLVLVSSYIFYYVVF